MEGIWRDLLLAVLGGLVALFGQSFLEKRKEARRRDVLQMALREELRAVAFTAPAQTFAGFTSQTFDELFADIGLLLPLGMAQTVIRYHLRMKHLESRIQKGMVGTAPTIEEVEDMEAIRDSLLNDLPKSNQ